MVTTAWLCIHTHNFPLLVLKKNPFMLHSFCFAFWFSMEKLPRLSENLWIFVFHVTLQKCMLAMVFVFMLWASRVVILLVLSWCHIGTLSRISDFFFSYQIYKILCLGKSLTTSGDQVLQSLSESNSFGQYRHLLNAAFIWDCSLREGNRLGVDNGNKERQGGLLVKLQDYFIW